MAPRRDPSENTLAEVDVLVERARGGDSNAFGRLVERFRPRIYALGLHLTGSRAEADDIAQEAFLRAYHRIGTFEGRSQFFTWIYRIAVNRALNGRRDGKRRESVGLDDPRVQAAIAVDAYGDPRRAAELSQSYTRLVAALDALSPTLRSTVVLVALQGLSHDEAGVVLGCPSGTVAWRMHDARARLRTAMADPIKETEEHLDRVLRLVPSF
ncbi:MAG: sigma-70 family RNA polymerase sigma factor [Polyangia bacterium]